MKKSNKKHQINISCKKSEKNQNKNKITSNLKESTKLKL